MPHLVCFAFVESFSISGCALGHRHIQKLERFYMLVLNLLQNRITNLEILDRADSTSIESMLIKSDRPATS